MEVLRDGFGLVLVGAGGLMATAQLVPIAKDFHVDTVPVSILGLRLLALTLWLGSSSAHYT